METLQLSQKEIKILLELLESQDLSESDHHVFDLFSIHEKLSSSLTYWHEQLRNDNGRSHGTHW